MTDQPTLLHLHLLSDSTGETLENIAKAVLSQFEGVEIVKHFWPLVRSEGHLDRVATEISRRPGLVLYTIADPEMRAKLEARSHMLGLRAISVLDPVIDAADELQGSVGLVADEIACPIPGSTVVFDELLGRQVRSPAIPACDAAS